MSSTELIAIYTEQGFLLDFDNIGDKKGLKNDQSEFQDKLYNLYKEGNDKFLYHLGFERFLIDNADFVHPSVYYLFRISRYFIEKLTTMNEIEYLRSEANINLSNDEAITLIAAVPFVQGTEHIGISWINNIWNRLSCVFSNEISSYTGTVQEYLSENDSSLYLAGRIYFHLVENKGDEEYPFAFLATYSVETKENNKRKVSHVPLKKALNEYKGQDEKLLQLLSTVSKAAQKSDFISDLIESGELFMPLKFTAREAYTFLTEIPLYEEAQIRCRIPDWWRKKKNSVSLSINIGEKSESKIGFDQLVSFNPKIMAGDAELSIEEIKSILQEAEGLLLIKGKWVEVNHEKLKAIISAYEAAERISDSGITLVDAMRMQFNISEQVSAGKDIKTEISYGAWLKGVLEKLREPTALENIRTAESFKASLRKYQETGYAWLNYMKTLGFGACLADDMGLGKTVQIIALLELMRINNDKQKVLLIIPASLIGNWKKELSKFAPELPFTVLHTSFNKEMSFNFSEDPSFLYITTYGMCVKLEALKEFKWDLVILDEAQAIKNPGTKQTKAVKQIPAGTKIAMTGTPIENRLSDLWSLFDFLNSGLLGTSKEFSTYAKNLNQDPLGYAKLRNLVSPFILRRLKTDTSIINDLPDKIEIKEYPELTKKQYTLYSQLVENLVQRLATSEGIERKGIVLSTIMKMKQICNHPDQFLGQGLYKPDHSGKFIMLQDICETIKEKRERVLVFTQFREMTEPLNEYLKTIFGKPGLVIHGGTSVKNRSEIVDEFNGESYVPYLVLSLKAGGVGLNLTAANHVIHFDRWWNPAVENQATDRAYRIGQKNDVVVHKLITEGTIEEKIDLMIEDKLKLAGDIISGTDENWILDMSNEELIDLFKFGGVKK